MRVLRMRHQGQEVGPNSNITQVLSAYMAEPDRVRCSLPQEREQMLKLLVWVVVGAAVLLVAPSLIAPRYRTIASDTAVRLVGIVIILFALGSTSYVHVPDGHLGQLFRVYGGGSLPAGEVLGGQRRDRAAARRV